MTRESYRAPGIQLGRLRRRLLSRRSRFRPDLSASAATSGSINFAYKVVAVAADTLEQSLPGIVSPVAITDATQADPVVVTSNSHALNDGDTIHIADVVGMTELNGRQFVVANKTTNTFELRGEDGTSHTAYASGGTFARDFTSANTAAMSTTNTITISWTAVAGAEKYDVFKEDNGIFGFIGETTGTSFTDDNIEADLTDTPPQQKNPFFGPNNKAKLCELLSTAAGVWKYQQQAGYHFLYANRQSIELQCIKPVA